MPGPGAYWFGREEMDEVVKVMQNGYLFRYGDENDPKFLHKVSTLEKEFAKYSGVCACNFIRNLSVACLAYSVRASTGG